MRENMGIYRGQTKDGEWVEGYYMQIIKPSHSILEISTEKLLNVLPETVGEWTGMKDKNGKCIFEGDIVECWSDGIKARGIVQCRVDGLWIIYPAFQKKTFWGLCPNKDGKTTVKIIGNATDNPELVKE